MNAALVLVPLLAASLSPQDFHGIHETLVAEVLGAKPTRRVALECGDSGCTFIRGSERVEYPAPAPADPQRLARAVEAIKRAHPRAEVLGCMSLDAASAKAPTVCKIDRRYYNKPAAIVVPPGGGLMILWLRP